MPEDDVAWMRVALAEARWQRSAARCQSERCWCKQDARLRARHNRTISDCDPTAHAEIVALRLGSQALGNYRLAGTTLYVTIEPCAMCAGAMIQARIARLVYGCAEPKGGAVRSCFAVFDHPMVNHRVEVIEGVLQEECLHAIQTFLRHGAELGARIRRIIPRFLGRRRRRWRRFSAWVFGSPRGTDRRSPVVHYEIPRDLLLQTEPLSDFLRHGHLALLPVALDRAIFAFLFY